MTLAVTTYSRTTPPLAGPRSLVIADHDITVTDRVQEQLHNLGYSAVNAGTSGRGLFEAVRTQRPDLVIADIDLEMTDGQCAARIIHRQFNVPVVAMAGATDPDQLEAALDADVHALLVKPISPAQLQASIAVAWNLHQKMQEHVREVEQLKQRLEERKYIEQAKWILVQRQGITEPEAMRTLQTQARSSRRKLVDVACSILETDELFKAAGSLR